MWLAQRAEMPRKTPPRPGETMRRDLLDRYDLEPHDPMHLERDLRLMTRLVDSLPPNRGCHVTPPGPQAILGDPRPWATALLLFSPSGCNRFSLP